MKHFLKSLLAKLMNIWSHLYTYRLSQWLVDKRKILYTASSKDKKDYGKKVKEIRYPPAYDPWGATILSSVLTPDRNHVRKYDLYSTDILKLHPNQKAEWEEIGWLVFCWTCCFTKKVF